MIDAAVLIPIYRTLDGQLHIVMILRNAGGVHGGQVAFPGGKRDQGDDTMLDTALREVREELGLAIDRKDVLAELPITQTSKREEISWSSYDSPFFIRHDDLLFASLV